LNLHLTSATVFRLQRRASVGPDNITVHNDIRGRTAKCFTTMLVRWHADHNSSGGGGGGGSSSSGSSSSSRSCNRLKLLICIQEMYGSYLGRNKTCPNLEPAICGQTNRYNETSRFCF